ncbi:MAG: DUF167 domain-containing protein [Spirochaetota bacterium]
MDKKAVLNITVTPKSSRSLVTSDDEGNVKVYLNSPPIEGKANKECIALISKKLKIPKSRVSIVKGEKGRSKRIEVKGLDSDDVLKLIKE